MKNQPMFGAPPVPELKLSQALQKYRAWRGSYAAYKSRRVQCDECVNVLHEARGIGEPPRSAVKTRTSPGGALRLCHGHTDLWREIDGIGKKTDQAPRRRR